MNNDDNGADRNEFPTIKPADISLTTDTESAADTRQTSGQTPGRTDRRIVIAFLLLLAISIGVIFFLPGWVNTTPVPSTDRQNATASDEASPPGTREQTGESPPGGTPWSDAQLSKLRKQSQDLLAEMLEAKETLEEHHVQQWAGDDFEQALQVADQGDTAYRERRFDEAVGLYRDALDRFNELVNDMDRVYEEAMEQGRQALDTGDAEQAARRFETALLIKPQDEAALRGQKRAGTLDEVNALIVSGDEALGEGRPEDARADYANALELDPHSEKANNRLQEANTRIRDRAFREAMSRGYTSLEAGRLEDARDAFAEAEKLKPGSAEATNSLNLARERITTRRINNHLESARRAAGEEDWQAAVEQYRQALALDNSLDDARSGLQYARNRHNLDQQLEQAISNPERLWDRGVREETRLLIRDAGSIDPAGPKLNRQITRLERMLEQATTPVTVQLQSDNQTSITVYKVGEMGKFEEKSLSLMPGRYVAVGTRPGYRDVRVEFTLRPGGNPDPVVIETREKINLGSR